MKELSALLVGNGELLTRSKDIFIDYSSIPVTKRYLLLENELQRAQKTNNCNLKAPVDYMPKINIEENKKLKRTISLKSLSDTSKRVKIDKKGYYMPAGLIPLLSNNELTKALDTRWGLTVNTGWLVVRDVGDPSEYWSH